jgi:hypothetical protein
MGGGSGCGNSGSGPSDAAVDAPVDAAFGPVGLWRLQSETTTFDDGGTRTLNDTDLNRVTGTVSITPTEYAIGVKHLKDGGLDDSDETATPEALITEHTAFGPADTSIALANGLGAVPFVWQKTPSEMLTLRTDGTHALAFGRYAWTQTTTTQIRGTVTVTPGGPPADPDHAVLVWIVRNGSTYDYRFGTPDIVPFTLDGNGKATFNLDRIQGAPGYSRVLYGTAPGPVAEIAIGLVVAYTDAGTLGTFDVATLDDKCTITTEDCVRGISAVAVAYRFGDSPELAASPFAYLQPGWSYAKQVYDHRNGNNRLGLVSLDATNPIPIDVFVPASPGQVNVPHFYLLSP